MDNPPARRHAALANINAREEEWLFRGVGLARPGLIRLAATGFPPLAGDREATFIARVEGSADPIHLRKDAPDGVIPPWRGRGTR